MWTLAGVAEASLIDRKSRFEAVAGPAGDEAEARDFLARHRNPDADHHCWAFRIGPLVRFQDDGEPGGTAGRPILQAIEGQGLDHVVVLVRRHFGGTLLGSGGLVRAYGGAAALCLKSASRIEIVARTHLTCAVPYGDLARVTAFLQAVDGLVLHPPSFSAEGPDLAFEVPDSLVDGLADRLADLTSGRVRLVRP